MTTPNGRPMTGDPTEPAATTDFPDWCPKCRGLSSLARGSLRQRERSTCEAMSMRVCHATTAGRPQKGRPMTGRAEGEPTSPGWYWQRGGTRWRVVEVCLRNGALIVDDAPDGYEPVQVDDPMWSGPAWTWGPRIPEPPSDPSAGEGRRDESESAPPTDGPTKPSFDVDGHHGDAQWMHNVNAGLTVLRPAELGSLEPKDIISDREMYVVREALAKPDRNGAEAWRTVCRRLLNKVSELRRALATTQEPPAKETTP